MAILNDGITQKATQDQAVNLESFEVIEALGKGSFGSVYLVRKADDTSGKHYAMKVLEKDKVLAQNLIRYAKTERNVLSLANHQFVVSLNFAFQSTSRLYLIMDYAPGGDMGMALAKNRRFPVELARVYAAEIVLAIEYLHNQNIIFRDLKPDNVVFDSEGHAMLTDFGLSKTGVGSQDMSSSFCGSVAYLAPEMLRRSGHTRSIDWYLLGVLIYEMLVGVPPYFNTSKSKLFENIQQGPLKIPHTMPQEARQIILLLLNRNPSKRLGAHHDAEEVKAHEFFHSINWDDIAARKGSVLKPEIRPIVQNPRSIKTFLQQEAESRARFADFEKTNMQQKKERPARVDNWSFIRPSDDREAANNL